MAGSPKTSKFVSPKGRPVGPTGEELYRCENCRKLWRTSDLCDAKDLHARIADGNAASTLECPKCGAMAFPAEGPPAEIVLGFYATQAKILATHEGHDVEVFLKKGKPILFCKTCGNKATRVVSEDEIAKVE